MAIIAKNISVGAIKPAPTETTKVPTFKSIKEHVQKKLEELPKKQIMRTEPEPQITKQLPKYIAKEEGELTKKINTKSQYMRDVYELDS